MSDPTYHRPGNFTPEPTYSTNTRTEPSTITEEEAAKTVHEAMYWAAEQKGRPQLWQNGNSLAEGKARDVARTILAASGHTALLSQIAELEAFKARVLGAVKFELAPAPDDTAIKADIEAGVSLRKCAAKHGITFGQVRGAIKRAALSRPLP